MSPKLQKIIRDIERTKSKIEELQALLPELERQKTELENAEVIKVFRSADVAPADFAEFIAAYRARAEGGTPEAVPAAPQPARYSGPVSPHNDMEESDDE
ncbi:MAG: DUF4315 family protein [Christensenellaceae bacterium]|nr:DUF4315 family protein [Christensenellaceae bacterium]